MLTPFDDFPVHQTSLPLARAGDAHPDFYDRFWFNGYGEDHFFALAMGLYPNRGVIDAAFSVVADGTQRSVFASARAPMDRTQTAVGPVRVEIVEPMRVNRLVVDAPDQEIEATLTYHARTPAFEEPRQIRWNEQRLQFDVTRATQLGWWEGTIRSGSTTIEIGAEDGIRGTKDRSWGIRPVGDPAPMAPLASVGQLFFLWAPINFDDRCFHYMVFEDRTGRPWSEVGAVIPVIDVATPVTGPGTEVERLTDLRHQIRWAPGLRRSEGATLSFRREHDGGPETIELEPLLTFRMSGAGYLHPRFNHGRWHDELVVDGEAFAVDDLDDLQLRNIHVQQVMRATWGDRTGLGVLEQLALGPHASSGFVGALDGAAGP